MKTLSEWHEEAWKITILSTDNPSRETQNKIDKVISDILKDINIQKHTSEGVVIEERITEKVQIRTVGIRRKITERIITKLWDSLEMNIMEGYVNVLPEPETETVNLKLENSQISMSRNFAENIARKIMLSCENIEKENE